MKCLQPYKPSKGEAIPCGKCFACRSNQQHTLVGRLALEAYCTPNDYISVVTLTYNDENIPASGELEPDDVTNFMHRFRKAYGGFRYFYAGEYGRPSLGHRPHYHMILYGVNPYHAEKPIAEKWGNGFVKIQEYRPGAARYVSKYVTKGKLSEPGEHAEGARNPRERKPEFARWSRKPAIGCTPQTVELIASRFTDTKAGKWYIENHEFFPSSFQLSNNGKRYTYPFDKNLKKAVSDYLGIQPEVDHDWILPMSPDEERLNTNIVNKARRRLRQIKSFKGTL